MAHPVDIIANVIRANGHLAAARQAEAVAAALTDERIIQGAVKALVADGWSETHDGGTLDQGDLRHVALAVLRSLNPNA